MRWGLLCLFPFAFREHGTGSGLLLNMSSRAQCGVERCFADTGPENLSGPASTAHHSLCCTVCGMTPMHVYRRRGISAAFLLRVNFSIRRYP